VGDIANEMTIRAAVGSLPPREREALVLRYFADFSVREVAALMRCPEGTVKTLTRRGIELLRRSGLVEDDDVELEEVSDAE
jgi:RNA polymerase sigma-70 factor (ECF subfamily)